MAKIIEAKAVISAQDKTGAVFDKLAKKFEGIAKTGKAFENIKPPVFGKSGWGANFQRDIDALRVSSKELAGIQKDWGAFNASMSRNGPMRASHYFGAVDQWKTKTLANLREVRLGMDETERAHKRFLSGASHYARHTASHVLGGFGVAYLAGHAIKSGAHAVAARNREEIREEIAGFTPEQQHDANRVADEVARRYPSLSRTDVLEDLRKNTARLGTFDRAKEMALVYAKARIANSIAGGDAHELEQVVRAAEGLGAANTPDQFKSFLNAWSKARSINADYTGERLRQDLAAAGSAKYGLGKDYMENVFPILASHTSGFGVKLATSNSALVGGRMTKASRAAMTAAGLLDKNGKLIDEEGYLKSPYEWTQKHIKPRLEAKGVQFSEHMSEHDKRIVTADTTKMFSARNTSDQIITNLLDAPLVEKARHRKTNVDEVDKMQHRDGGIAWQGVEKQLGDFATAVGNTSFVIGRMDSFANALARFTSTIETGNIPLESRGGKLINWLRGNDAPLEGKIPMPKGDPRRLPDGSILPMPTSDPRNQIPDFPDDRVPMPIRDPRRLHNGKRIPFPMPDPRNEGESWTPPPLDASAAAAAPAKVDVEVRPSSDLGVNIKIDPSTYFTALVERVEKAIKLVSSIASNHNGPGSSGRSSPDAGAASSGGQ